nr:putative LPS assembly protein LptD [Pararhodonellum marinum]
MVPDTLLNPSTLPLPLDTLLLSDSLLLPGTDTAKVVPKSDIEFKVNYAADDSIVSDFTQNKVFLYKNAWFEYGNIRLDADYIAIDWELNELKASGLADTAGVVQGAPIFKEGNSTYEIRKEMRYNFKTQKAIISDVVTEQQDGLLRGQTVKKDQDGSVYLSHGMYTTCNLAEPHWHISSKKIKSIRGKQVVTGPFNLYFNGIPTPLGLPMGLLPDQPEEKNSGIIIPSYGEEQIRGFFLRDFGYYFAFSDYLHAKVTGDIYSKGGYGAKMASLYKKRYRFGGGFNIDFQAIRSPETEANPLDVNSLRVMWQHTPETRGNSRFSASLNAGTSSYFNNVVNPNNFLTNVNSEFTSNIAYSKTFAGTPFSMSANLRHSQSIQTGEVNLMLPEVAINMNRQNPFRNMDFEPLKTLNIAYDFNMRNSIDNRVTLETGVQSDLIQDNLPPGTPELIDFTFANLPQLLRDADNGFQHRVPITSNFTLFKFFTGTGSVTVTELWYLDRINYFYNPIEQRVDRIRENGFNRVNYFTSSFSMTTNIYGFYKFKPKSKIEAIRHHIQPNISFNFNPDFSTPAFGYFQNVQVDETGRTQLFSRHQGFIFGGAPIGESRAIAVSIRNVFEGKLRIESDTAETKTKKIPLLETLNIQGSYNFAADSFNLSNINMSTRTAFFDKKINVALSANLDPYATQAFTNPNDNTPRVRRVNDFAWRRGQGIGVIRNATLNLNGSLNPSRSERNPAEVRDDLTNEFLNQGGQMNEFVQNEIERVVNDPSLYIDWSIPWNLSFGYNLSYNKGFTGNTNITQAVNLNGDLSLSDKWKINFNSGFDLSTGRITQSMIGIARDLHCWQMNVNWVPFGRFTSYNIDIRVKSSILQDLKVSRRRSFFDNLGF